MRNLRQQALAHAGTLLKPVLVLGMCSLAGPALQAQEPERIWAGVEPLKVLQSIEPGLWSLRTGYEPEPSRPQPRSAAQPPVQTDSGCLSPQSIAEDLQDLLSQESDGLSCTGKLLANDEDLGLLQISCPVRSKKDLQRSGRIFQAPPAVVEIRRLTAASFRVTSKARDGARGAGMVQVQDYEREGDCPQ